MCAGYNVRYSVNLTVTIATANKLKIKLGKMEVMMLVISQGCKMTNGKNGCLNGDLERKNGADEDHLCAGRMTSKE